VSQLAVTLGCVEEAERRQALRMLLRQPLVRAAGHEAEFAGIVRHRLWLSRWFAEQPGWRLSVDPAAGFARLAKVPHRPDATRPASLQGKPPFDRRRYALLCLTLAALDDHPGQTTLCRLAELVAELSDDPNQADQADGAGEPSLRRFDATRYGERRALVDVLRWLVEHGVLVLRDGDVERYVAGQAGDALYDVDDRILAQLVAAPVPPAVAGRPERLTEESYPATEDGQRQRARHQVFRALLDDPVVYYEDLEPRARDWLEHSRGFVYRELGERLGFQVERRQEGLAAVDPSGEVTDTRFPDAGSTVKHAALLLGELLCTQAPIDPMADDAATALAASLLADVGQECGWSLQYAERPAQLAADALGFLASFGLAERTASGWRPRPALARFAAAAAPPWAQAPGESRGPR
jgi:uncharacterized protein (TIGR02678 family)